MNPEPDLAAIYRRVSTDHQDDSLAVQESSVLDYCRFKKLAVTDALTFSDPDTSGRTPILDRTGGGNLMRRLALGGVRHLVIAKLDRLGRNVRDALAVLDFLQKNQIVLHITNFGGETISTQGHMGRLILTVLLAVAEWEAEEIRDRTRKVLDRKFDALELTGNVPFGFDCRYIFADGHELLSPQAISNGGGKAEKNDLALLVKQHGKLMRRQLEPNSIEQDIIRSMSSLRQSGQSLKAIADLMNLHGHRTKLGSHWQTGHVYSILNSRHTQLVLAKPEIEQQAA